MIRLETIGHADIDGRMFKIELDMGECPKCHRPIDPPNMRHIKPFRPKSRFAQPRLHGEPGE